MKQIREIRVADLLSYLLLPLVLTAVQCALYIFISRQKLPSPFKLIIYIAMVPVSYYLLKRLAIGLVLAYKAFAPMSLRRQCRFEPSCSTYMVMAINKYGLFIGAYKGLRRILRCHPPNGGEDYP